jgi:hypothetical protein
MTYLVDANVISEPTKPVPLSNVVDWLSATSGISSWTPSFWANYASAFSLCRVVRSIS